MQTITIDNITYNLVPVETPQETPVVQEDYKKPRYKKYYYVDSIGNSSSANDTSHSADYFRYTTHNYFETSDEMIQYRDYLLALGRINHRIFELNEGWIPEWNSSFIYKYIAILQSERGEWSAANYGNRIMMSIFTYAKSEDILENLFVEMAIDFETVRLWMMR